MDRLTTREQPLASASVPSVAAGCWERREQLCDCEPGTCLLQELMSQGIEASPLALLRPL